MKKSVYKLGIDWVGESRQMSLFDMETREQLTPSFYYKTYMAFLVGNEYNYNKTKEQLCNFTPEEWGLIHLMEALDDDIVR